MCFLRRDNRVLLIHRRNPPNAGMWNGIGGKLEAGEDPYAACLREIREETALAVDRLVLRALLVVSVKSTGDLWVIFVFTAKAPSGAAVPSSEGDLEWVEIDRVAARSVPRDLPALLPRVFEEGDISVTRLEYETDAVSS